MRACDVTCCAFLPGHSWQKKEQEWTVLKPPREVNTLDDLGRPAVIIKALGLFSEGIITANALMNPRVTVSSHRRLSCFSTELFSGENCVTD